MWPGNFVDWGNGFCNWGPSFGSGHWFMGWLFPLLFWGIILYFFIWLIKQFIPRRQSKSDSALEILRKRYAAGEITQQEFATIASK
jgi:putative membrane protein